MNKFSPKHYQRGKIQVWDFIADQNLDFILGNVVKYVCRAGHKNQEDEWNKVEDVLSELQKYIKSGKIRYVGLSNETPWGILNFLKIADKKKLPRMMTVQNCYSLVNRVFDIANSEGSIREQCGLLAYSPLAGGRLSGKYINEQRYPRNK